METILSKIVLSILFVILSIFNFIRIDLLSHSASDTLRLFILQALALALILYLLYRIIKKKISKKVVEFFGFAEKYRDNRKLILELIFDNF